VRRFTRLVSLVWNTSNHLNKPAHSLPRCVRLMTVLGACLAYRTLPAKNLADIAVVNECGHPKFTV
jgi:hypothetical protein